MRAARARRAILQKQDQIARTFTAPLEIFKHSTGLAHHRQTLKHQIRYQLSAAAKQLAEHRGSTTGQHQLALIVVCQRLNCSHLRQRNAMAHCFGG